MITIGPPACVAAFDIDAQNCFTPLCPDELPVPDGYGIVSELNQQAALAGCRIGSKDAHSPHALWVANDQHPQLSEIEGYDNLDLRWNLHAVPGTKGFELLEGLPKPADYDYFVWKGVEADMHPYGACYHDLQDRRSTGVIEFLKTHNIDTVIAGGLAFDFCVKTTVLQLLQAGFRVIVNRGATRSLLKETETQALVEMTKAGAEFIECAGQLKSQPYPNGHDRVEGV